MKNYYSNLENHLAQSAANQSPLSKRGWRRSRRGFGFSSLISGASRRMVERKTQTPARQGGHPLCEKGAFFERRKAPEFVRKTEVIMGNAQNCSDFQEKYLEQLKTKSLAELSALPDKERINTPHDFGGWKVFLLRKNGEHGGIRIEVEGKKRFLLIFVTAYRTGFEILPDGRIIEDEGFSEDED